MIYLLGQMRYKRLRICDIFRFHGMRYIFLRKMLWKGCCPCSASLYCLKYDSFSFAVRQTYRMPEAYIESVKQIYHIFQRKIYRIKICGAKARTAFPYIFSGASTLRSPRTFLRVVAVALQRVSLAFLSAVSSMSQWQAL